MMFKKDITVNGRKITVKDIFFTAGVLVMIVIYVVFNNLSTSAADEKVKLEKKISQARAAYSRALESSDVQALEEEKAQLQSQTSMVFPSKEAGAELITLLWVWIEDSGLQIATGLSSIVSDSVTLGEVQCFTNTVTVSVKGKAEQLTELLRYIKESDIGTIVVSNMSAKYAEPDWTMDMKVTAYTAKQAEK